MIKHLQRLLKQAQRPQSYFSRDHVEIEAIKYAWQNGLNLASVLNETGLNEITSLNGRLFLANFAK